MSWRRWAEWAAFLALAALAFALHVRCLRHAGGLWRDEVVTAAIAGSSTLGELWASLMYDSFPGLVHLCLRFLISVGADGDASFRLFGAAVGTATIAALWWNARSLASTLPLVSLSLFGISGLAIRFGDSVRAYGLGTLLLLLSVGCVWRLAVAPSRQRLALALACSVLSAQALYQNVFLLAAVYGAGLIVVARRGSGRVPWSLVAAGLGAALSMLPYLPIVARVKALKALIPYELTLERVALVFGEALAAVAGIGLGGIAVRRGEPARPRKAEAAVFALASLVLGGAFFLAFLMLTDMPTQPWYYIPFLGLGATCLDVLVWIPTSEGAGRIGRVALAVVAAAIGLGPAWDEVRTRMTNVDLIARQLEGRVAAGDLVLVYPWYCATTFQRYYRGVAGWTTVPPLARVDLQQKDLFRERMTTPNVMAPVLAKSGQALASGHRIWVVGDLPTPPMGALPPAVPPAPHPAWGWDHDAYALAWGLQIGHYLQAHAVGLEALAPPSAGPVNPYENLPVFVVSGWRGD